MESVKVQCVKLVVATCHAVDSKCFDVIYVSSGCSSLKENVTSHISWKGNLSKAKPSPKGEWAEETSFMQVLWIKVLLFTKICCPISFLDNYHAENI